MTSLPSSCKILLTSLLEKLSLQQREHAKLMFFLLFHALKNENKNSGQNRETFPERADAKNKLMCSICLKEFKSLPALNGHMRSHGGVRASPNFKQVESI